MSGLHLARHAVVLGASLTLGGAVALAQTGEAPQRLERVEITGSALRRLDAQTALPVQVLRREDIERSGAGSTAELLQSLPAMQFFTNESASIGGGGLGFSGASIHNLEEVRTLVLLNGRRLAGFAGQFLTGGLAGVDLNTIPLAAIERIEILADGASAVYGADAIGGVVNFITRRGAGAAELSAGVSLPAGGAREKRLGLSKGFGDLGVDGFNVLLAAGYERRSALEAIDRKFSNTSVIDFDLGGRPASFFNASPRSAPGNIQTADGNLVSPELARSGACPSGQILLEPTCYFDVVRDIQLLPERERGNVFASGQRKLDGRHSLFGEMLLSSTRNTNRIAPPPGEVLVGADSPFWPTVQATNDWYWSQFLGEPVQAPLDPTPVSYRVFDVGRRTQTDKTVARHFVLGGEGALGAWDYHASLTHSVNRQATRLQAGHVALTPFLAALDSGLVDPFAPPGAQSSAAQQALDAARLSGFWEGGESRLDVAQLRVSRELMALPAGALAGTFGVSYSSERFEKSASAIAQGIGDLRLGDETGIVPYRARRHAWSAFAEALAPLAQRLELGAALRHDRYSDFGGASTGKLSLRWQPRRSVLLRGSLGTGFKAPTVPQVHATEQAFGVTAGSHDCTGELAAIAAGLGAVCPTGPPTQFSVRAGGNRDLKPERSDQWSVGFRVEPAESLSIGADLWSVHLRRAIGQVSEQAVFDDPARWAALFTSVLDPATGQSRLALLQTNTNLGENIQRGIDVEAVVRLRTPLGRLTSQLALSRHLKDRYQLDPDGPFLSSLGAFESGRVTFRWQGRWQTSLEVGRFVHTLGLTFRSGYADQNHSEVDCAVFFLDDFSCTAFRGRVKSYQRLDWQTQWRPDRAVALSGGLLNVFDRSPPRSLKNQGGGQVIGFDDRYYDPRGRTFHANLSYRF